MLHALIGSYMQREGSKTVPLEVKSDVKHVPGKPLDLAQVAEH
jgi:hypothetical protein